MTPAKVMLRKFAESPKAIARFRLVYGSVYSCIHCEPGGATYARHSVGKIGRKTKLAWDWRGNPQLFRAACPTPPILGTYTHRDSAAAASSIPVSNAQ
ncbi:hypothetical protein HBH44_021970 [Parastagonospora nodorum]|nr:hypothetical protein HBH44_021970 [Parastagonospora nodorum]KAH4584110.1 hypothetical protein HBH84_023290 [Parastagonospora nodorum]KAH4635479.1 hypothetical protein HBH81_126410 [Parastagonospora nodorum]KAH4642354.1 hypothetical protein HBH55_020830 [Parastagonospora nodorum]KAH4943644.1 hypothetical protein HBI79_020750 [Parastagonospora nodorum]